MSKQKWRRRNVPRWLVRCAPHQAIAGLIPPDVCFGAGCRPEDLISRGLSSPCYRGPEVRILLPPAASRLRTGLPLAADRVPRDGVGAAVFSRSPAGFAGFIKPPRQAA